MRSLSRRFIPRFAAVTTIGVVSLFIIAAGVANANRPDENGIHDPPHGDDSEPPPSGASIDLLNCDNGDIAKWNDGTVTYSIVQGVADADDVASVRAGANAWHGFGGLAVTEVASGGDITIELVGKIVPGSIIGAAGITCASAAVGITSASIVIGVKGLNDFGVQNVAAHEVGHALGLGHADTNDDLMGPRFERKAAGKSIVCISNLDDGGLNETTDDPFSVAALVCA